MFVSGRLLDPTTKCQQRNLQNQLWQSSWWSNHPSDKDISQNGNLLQIGVNMKHIWSQHLAMRLKNLAVKKTRKQTWELPGIGTKSYPFCMLQKSGIIFIRLSAACTLSPLILRWWSHGYPVIINRIGTYAEDSALWKRCRKQEPSENLTLCPHHGWSSELMFANVHVKLPCDFQDSGVLNSSS